jgi:signal transduction histidine kinase
MSSAPTRVLLIEDNPGDSDLIRLRLVEANSDIDVACASRLSTGLEFMQDKPPSLVLLDLNLPDSKGAETFRNVLKSAPGIPVVILSGQDDEELAAKAVYQGVQDYLVKGGFDSKQLARAMRYAMERQALLTSLDISRKQQLQFKNEFLSHVSHELRTPLTAIHQFVTILLDGLEGNVPPEQREHLQTILRSANQLHSMINDLLEATRAESGKLQVEPRCISISDVIEQAVSMLRATGAAKRIGIEMAVDSRVPLVFADPERVLQILLNLIDNAIKFTPADGSVIIKACLVEPDLDFVYVSVVDTGRGIAPEARPLIFERLYQDPRAIDDSRKGLGLGLYIVHELVRLNGGRVWVESQLGHGSTFAFTLPLFSLSKVLLPIITDQGRLRESLFLLMVEQEYLSGSQFGDWKGMRREALEILQACIFPDKDIVLPVLGNSTHGETYVIVASADKCGADILHKRIRGQLDRSGTLQASSLFDISTIEVPFPPQKQADEPLLKRVQEVADVIGETLLEISRPERLRTQRALGQSNAAPQSSSSK